MRIRYRKTRTEGTLESVRRYQHPTNGARYKILIVLPEHKWMIVDDNSELIAASGLRVHRHKLKIDVREALEKLGVVLETDSRSKRTTKVV